MELSTLRSKLHQWYIRHKRDLPWRETNDPYRIWLSEIILQQTRVNQGLPYYEKFVSNYPDVNSLAKAPQEKVLKDWEGLGYYSRARNMHFSAKQIAEEFQGVFPSTLSEIKSLKGVGDYTAAAIGSFAFNLPAAVLDGNVFRFLSRIYAEETPINTGKGKKVFQNLADEFLDIQNPALHNQAIMEFGAQYCLPKNPACADCIFASDCIAYKNNRVAELPNKERKSYNRERHLNYLMIEMDGSIWLEQRTEGIWKGLFQFPLIESIESLDEAGFWAESELQRMLSTGMELLRVDALGVHKLSHQTLFIKIWTFKILKAKDLSSLSAYKPIQRSELSNLAFPRPLRKFLDEKQLTLPL